MAGLTPVFCALLVQALVQNANSLIPAPCATAENLASKECCPTTDGPCGESQGRGKCERVTVTENTEDESDDIRYEWPMRLFNRLCVCNGNYGGYDCKECKFGYTMDAAGNCVEQRVRVRRSLKAMTDSDWTTYVGILDRAKKTDSRYYVLTEAFYAAQDDQARAGSLVNPTLYDLFIWMHHLSAKDNEETNGEVDFAHEATGFLTWHRLYLLWFEREIQLAMNQSDFTFSYWEWTDPNEREDYVANRLSVTDPPFSEWPTYCWYETQDGTICDPTLPTGNNLRRCPLEAACRMGNESWPSEKDAQESVSVSTYDRDPFDNEASESFRNFLEGFVQVDSCDDIPLCANSVARKLHNSVHILLGIGDFTTNLDFRKKGVMADVAASPNDPIFINHHTMVDCIMEEWMKCYNPNNDLEYPLSSKTREGHRRDDYIVPFIPLYNHQDMLKTSESFGYSCDLEIEFDCPSAGGQGSLFSSSTIAVLASLVGAIASTCY
jgi:hypothetical protein